LEGDHPSQAVRYGNASKVANVEIVDSVGAVTGFNRDYAQRALRQTLWSIAVKSRRPGTPNV
jgi:hypothetical protein